MRTRTTEIDSKIIELYQVQGQRLSTVAEVIGWPMVTTYRRIRELGIRRDRATVNKLRAESLMGHPVSEIVRHAVSKANRGRHPKNEFQKGQVPWNKGKKMPPETGQKVAAKLRGRPTWNKGIPITQWMSEEGYRQWREAHKQNPVRYWLGKKRSPETVAKIQYTKDNQPPEVKAEIIRKWMKSLCYRPNKSEIKLLSAIQENNLPYEYVGDGKVVIDGLCPDFINTNGEKKIIELFGKLFHEPSDETKKAERYGKYGFQLLVIWDSELRKMDNVIVKVKEFTGR